MRIYNAIMKILYLNYVSNTMYTLPKIKKGIDNP